jgi:Ca2+-binding RTX toxin-like protein
MRYVQTLETRSLLSAVLTDAGVLTVTGTAGNDSIGVYINRDGKVAVAESLIPVRPADRTKPERPVPTITTFDADAVKSIVINAGDGGDFVGIADRGKRAVKVGATLNGEAGNDKLSGSKNADTINGGVGNDWIVGGAGDDVLNGGAGNDRILSFDRTGKDTVDGGDNDAVSDTNKGDTAVVDATDVVSNVESSRTGPLRGHGPRGGGRH